MNTFKEENPIMYRIDQMRKNWEDHVCDNTQLVRWVLLKDEVRMLKAFSLLEASEYGQIPDFFINFDVPFSSVERYGYDLLTSWLEIWNNPDARAEVADANGLFSNHPQCETLPTSAPHRLAASAMVRPVPVAPRHLVEK